MQSAVALLRQRNFGLLFFGRCISFLGNAMAPVALAFAVLQISGSASALGIVLAARMAPNVVFLLIGGVIADRLPRSAVLVGTNVVGGAAQAVVAGAPVSGGAAGSALGVLRGVNGGAVAAFRSGRTSVHPPPLSPNQPAGR